MGHPGIVDHLPTADAGPSTALHSRGASLRMTIWLLLLRAGAGQCEEEAAAAALCAFDPDAAAVLLDDAAAECKAEACAAEGASVACVALVEALEDCFHLLRGD